MAVAEVAVTEDPLLAEKFRLPPTNGTNEAFRTLARKMLEQGQAQRELLAKHGLADRLLEDLAAAVDQNEVQMVITSMNMYEFSEKNNREMGVLVESTEAVYQEAVTEARSIVAAAEAAKSPRPRGHHQAPKEGDPGFCIRCRKRIAYEPELPYCEACGAIWAQYENPNYREEVCHSCGRGAETSMNKPLCYRCYRDEGY